MTTKEFIDELERLDPLGDCQVWLGGDVHFMQRIPWYYDGKAAMLLKDEKGKIVGMREATVEDGDKIIVHLLSITDMGDWEVELNLFPSDDYEVTKFDIQGSEYFHEKFQKGLQSALKTYEEIAKTAK